MKRTNLLIITGLALGWLFDFLFWKANQGVNFAIYVLLCLVGGFLVLRLNDVKPSWKALILLIPIAFFAAFSFIRLEPLSMALAFLLTLGLMGLLAVTYLGGRWPWYSLGDYIANFAKLGGSMAARGLMFRSERVKSSAALVASGEIPAAAPRTGAKRFWAIFRGVIIALPILVIFAALLSSADIIFAQRLEEFTKIFRIEKLPEYLFRAIYILIGAYALMGIFLHAAQKSQDEKLLGMDKPLIPPFLGFTEASIVLGAVVLLFAAFVAIQFRYFFGGHTNISVDGYTYSEYARRGFGELVAVAFFSLLLFLGLGAVVKRVTPTQRWTFSGLGVAMVTLVGVMLVSAFQRLLLYESAFGFTRLRMYTHVFMIWLGMLLAATVVLELLRKERQFAFMGLLATLGFAASLMLINVDATIARQNIARSPQGEGLDVAYLASLSTDSVPALAQMFSDPALPAATRDGIGAALFCRKQIHDQPAPDWRGFTLSRWKAEKALAPLQEKLDNYVLENEEYPISILSPANTSYDCYGSMGD